MIMKHISLIFALLLVGSLVYIPAYGQQMSAEDIIKYESAKEALGNPHPVIQLAAIVTMIVLMQNYGSPYIYETLQDFYNDNKSKPTMAEMVQEAMDRTGTHDEVTQEDINRSKILMHDEHTPDWLKQQLKENIENYEWHKANYPDKPYFDFSNGSTVEDNLKQIIIENYGELISEAQLFSLGQSFFGIEINDEENESQNEDTSESQLPPTPEVEPAPITIEQQQEILFPDIEYPDDEYIKNKYEGLIDFEEDFKYYQETEMIRYQGEIMKELNNYDIDLLTNPDKIKEAPDNIPDNESLASKWDNPNDPFPPKPFIIVTDPVTGVPFAISSNVNNQSSTPDPNRVDPTDIPDGKDSDNPFDPDYIPEPPEGDWDNDEDPPYEGNPEDGDIYEEDPQPAFVKSGSDPFVRHIDGNIRDKWLVPLAESWDCESIGVERGNYDNDRWLECPTYGLAPTVEVLVNNPVIGESLDWKQLIDYVHAPYFMDKKSGSHFTHVWQDLNGNMMIDEDDRLEENSCFLKEIDEWGFQEYQPNGNLSTGKYVCGGEYFYGVDIVYFIHGE